MRSKRLLLLLTCVTVAAYTMAGPLGTNATAWANGDETKQITVQAKGTPMTLAEAIEFALAHTPRLAAAGREVGAAAQMEVAARREYAPRFDLSFTGTQWAMPRRVMPNTPEDMFQGEDRFSSQIYALGPTVALPLSTGGRIPATIAWAGLMRQAATQRANREQDKVVAEVTAAYYNILFLNRLHEAYQVALGAMDELLRVAQEFFDVGKIPEYELLQTKAERADVEQGKIAVESQQQVAQATLHTLIGWTNADSPVLPTEQLTAPEGISLADIATLTGAAREHRPDYLAMQNELGAAKQQVRIQEAMLRPEVMLEGMYGGMSGRKFHFLSDWNAMVSARVLLGDRGRTRAMVKQKEEEAGKAEADLRQMELEIDLEVRSAYAALTSAQAREQASRTAVDAAKAVLTAEQLKYSVGKGVAWNVILAERAVLNALADYAMAVADEWMALADLKQAVGMDELPAAQAQVPTPDRG